MKLDGQFKFLRNNSRSPELSPVVELFFDEHFYEVIQRFSQGCFLFCFFVIVAFVNIKDLVELLKVPIGDIHFFQLSPGEYFFSTLKIAFYTGLVSTIPFVISQIIFFLLPGLNEKEQKNIALLLITSNVLFILGLLFSYFILAPAALKFLVIYGADIIEPLWSFDEYCSFVTILFFSTGLVFQIPIFQVLLSLLKLMSGKDMIKLWKYVVLFATMISAVLTPSTDPLTQILLSLAILFLYFLGAIFADFFVVSF
jgi:sec-independent protein translocase protein TatC